MILNCGRWWRKIWIFLLYRHAIAAVISAHILGGGYAAGYYAYLWTQMLADDGYSVVC